MTKIKRKRKRHPSDNIIYIYTFVILIDNLRSDCKRDFHTDWHTRSQTFIYIHTHTHTYIHTHTHTRREREKDTNSNRYD